MTVPGRECGPCYACCVVTDIVQIGKKAGEACRHLVIGGGCGIYEARPDVCRTFECGWKLDPKFRADERPDLIGIMVMGLALQGGSLNVAHELRKGAFTTWKGDRLLKRESKHKWLGLADFGKPATLDKLRLAGPKRAVNALDARAAQR